MAFVYLAGIMEELQEKRWKKVVRKLFKVLRVLFIVLFSLVFVLALLAYLLEDKIKQYAIDQINQHLTSEIKVESIDLSFFSKFPYASLEFTNVLIKDPPAVDKEKDTLLYAHKLFLEFSIWDVFMGDYDVKRIEVERSDIRLYVDQKGNENYHIWKDSRDTTGGKFSMELEKVLFRDAKIAYNNKYNKLDFAFDVKELNLKGKFSDEQFSLETRINSRVLYFRNRNIQLLSNKSCSAEATLNVNTKNGETAFQSGKLRLGDMGFAVNGKVTDEPDNTRCDIAINGDNIHIESLLKTFPSLLGEDLGQYETKGMLNFKAQVNGNSSKTETPGFAAQFEIKDAFLREKKNNISLEKLTIRGNYDSENDNKKEELNLEYFSGRFRDGQFTGAVSLVDLEAPKLKAKVDGSINLSTLQQFFHFKEINSVSGGLSLSAKLDGELKQNEADEWELEVQQSSGFADVSKMQLQLKDHSVQYRDFNGRFVLSKDNAIVENLSGYLGKSDVIISGVLHNLVPYLLLKNEKLNIVADFHSEHLDLDDLLKNDGSTTGNTEAKSTIQLPDDINFNFDVSVNETNYSTFSAKNIAGNFKLIDQRLTGNNLSLRFAKGICTGNLSLEKTEEEVFGIRSNLTIEEMDVVELFVLFKEFGQTSITSKNLKGRVSAKVEFLTAITPYLEIEQNRIVSLVDLVIKDGELNNLAVMNDIIKYMRSSVKIKLALGKNINDLDRRLQHIKFSTLSNLITIRDEKVIIPDMEINSSALKINFSATHHFNDSIEYEFNFRFIDLKAANNETEYGTIADDGTGLKIYIRMYGTLSHPLYDEDRDSRKEERKKYNEKEKENLKAIMQKEFGLFKKDSTLKVKETPVEEVKFLLEWDKDKPLEEQQKNAEENKKIKEKNNKERIDKVKKKLGVEEAQQPKFEVE